jgi:hypothetical protein
MFDQIDVTNEGKGTPFSQGKQRKAVNSRQSKYQPCIHSAVRFAVRKFEFAELSCKVEKSGAVHFSVSTPLIVIGCASNDPRLHAISASWFQRRHVPPLADDPTARRPPPARWCC